MKIIIANYRYFIAGGPERYMFNFIAQAEARGITCIPFSVDYARNLPTPYDKYFVSPRGSREDIQYDQIKKTPRAIFQMLSMTLYNREAEKKLRALIRAEKPDAVYILHEINSLSPSIIRAAKKEGVRVIHRISDFFMFCPKLDFLCGDQICESCLGGHYRKALKCRCVKGSLPATAVRVAAMKLYRAMDIFSDVDAFISTCQFTRQKLIQGGVPGEKIRCIPTFISAEEITPCYENQGYFLFLGRFAQQKGAIHAVRAMAKLKDLPVKLKITGLPDDSPEYRAIARVLEEEQLQSKVEFVGFQHGQALHDLICGAIAVVNPAIWYENLPNTVLEAYAHGKCVVASSVGSLAEVVQEGVTGLLFPLGDSSALAEKLRLLSENAQLPRTLGRNARRVSEEIYAPQRHMDAVCALLAGETQ